MINSFFFAFIMKIIHIIPRIQNNAGMISYLMENSRRLLKVIISTLKRVLQLRSVSFSSGVTTNKNFPSAKILAVGGGDHKRAELLNTKTMEWIKIEDYPFADYSLNSFAMVFHENSFIVFGGEADATVTQTVVRLDETTIMWIQIGKLQIARKSHGVVFDGISFVIVGGVSHTSTLSEFPSIETEKCQNKNETITCKSQEPDLKKYLDPALILIDEEFGKNHTK